jgi:glycosyltransferase involved in cell wall biosynthesis
VSDSPGPLVSVGVTSYRRPEGLEKLLVCLLEQTYSNLEIIISDNCSSMAEIEALLTDYAARDSRVRVFRQHANIGVKPNHTFLARQASGEFFLWLHEDDDIPRNYIERCVARFSDSPQIALVGSRADAFWEGRYWFTYKNYSDLGENTYTRLGCLILIAYTDPSAFQQYFFGVFRREALIDCIWEDGQYYYREKFSLIFRIAEQGYIHFADDVTFEKHNLIDDSMKWRRAEYVDKPLPNKILGKKFEKLAPMTWNIMATVSKSERLSYLEKARLLLLCLLRFMGAWMASKTPLGRRIIGFPRRVLGTVRRIIRRALQKVLRSL